jgi:lipid II:glycine glycyltransferase (peptidoglycan interpeptide bridge formation enzyme)
LPPQPFAFFLQIFENIIQKGQGFIALATHEKKPLSASVYFHLGDQAIYKYGASDLRFQEFRASNLVMWEAMRWCSAHGLASLDFGRTSIGNEGLRRFKLQFGAREETIHYYRFDYRTNSFVASKDQAEGWFNRFFRVMPISVLRVMGELLYRHMT